MYNDHLWRQVVVGQKYKELIKRDPKILVSVDRWSLFGGGRCLKLNCKRIHLLHVLFEQEVEVALILIDLNFLFVPPHPVSDIRAQFHQRSTLSFCANSLVPVKYKPITQGFSNFFCWRPLQLLYKNLATLKTSCDPLLM